MLLVDSQNNNRYDGSATSGTAPREPEQPTDEGGSDAGGASSE